MKLIIIIISFMLAVTQVRVLSIHINAAVHYSIFHHNMCHFEDYKSKHIKYVHVYVGYF